MIKKIKNFFSGIGEKLVDHSDEVTIGGYALMIVTYMIYMIALTYAVFTGKFTPKA